MQNYENRVINGILKADQVTLTPEIVFERLSSNIQIIVDDERLNCDDLWPCVWALTKVLEKQFFGEIYVCSKATVSDLPRPVQLGKRVIFTTEKIEAELTIGLGTKPNSISEKNCFFGDVRGSRISFGHILPEGEKGHPISCFALAGYLGYAALAKIIGIPDFRADYAMTYLDLPFTPELSRNFSKGLTIVGLGQLGQAYLTLLFFLNRSVEQEIFLLDKDRFEDPNYHTQILLDEDKQWTGRPKALYLEEMFKKFGWNVRGEKTELKWGWSRPLHHPPLAMLGLDKFEPRRMAMNAGYDWIFESGLGTSFLHPKVSWHSLLPVENNEKFFKDEAATPLQETPISDFEKSLQDSTPGGCGWVTYKGISATAPAMGLVASAFVWSEIFNHNTENPLSIKGNAFLWTPLLPILRETL
ncbi:MAG TPA: hypothetical protein PKY82_26830 [Pyrinomonadaceae bacterium]|nr:hypothetical protein [Pyrinomonadaceae bacterium]